MSRNIHAPGCLLALLEKKLQPSSSGEWYISAWDRASMYVGPSAHDVLVAYPNVVLSSFDVVDRLKSIDERRLEDSGRHFYFCVD